MSSIGITTSFRAATGVLQNSFVEPAPSLAIEVLDLDSSEALDRKEKLGESEDSEVVFSNNEDGPSLASAVSGRGLRTVLSVRSQAGTGEPVRVFISGSHIFVSGVSDTEGGVSADFSLGESDRDVVEISLLVQIAGLEESSSLGAAINEVDLGLLVSVRVFGACVG